MPEIKPTTIYIERRNDADVVLNLKAVVKELGVNTTASSCRPTYLTNDIENPFTTNSAALQQILDLNAIVITTFRLTFNNGISLSLQRHFDQQNAPQPMHDDIQITAQIPGAAQADAMPVAKAIAAVRKHFTPIDSRTVLEHLSDDQKRYYTERDSSLHRLETMQDQFFEKLQEFTLKQTADATKHRQELEEQFKKLGTDLEKKHSDNQANLDAERAKLADKEKAMDLRDSTAARRGIHEKVMKLLEERAKTFEITEGAKAKRKPVLWMFVLLIGLLGSLVGYNFWQGVHDQEQVNAAATTRTISPWLVGRQITSGLALVVTIGFFIRWLNQFSQEHIVAEFNMKQFELDFQRASFVVEWALEWSKEKGEAPQYLIERLSRNLFDTKGSDGTPVTAGEALASVFFGSAANLKLRIAGNELEFDRKGLQKMENT